MPKTAAKDFLELVNSFINDKLLFISKTSEDKLEVIKVLDNGTGIDLKENDVTFMTDTY